MKVFIGMETSGVLRRGFCLAGHAAVSCDTLPAEDGAAIGHHWQGDVFMVLERLMLRGWVPDVAIFHPTCTYLTNSAEWAYADPDFERYPGVGYHQQTEPGTLLGAARRAARKSAIADVDRIDKLEIEKKIVENPVGVLSSAFRQPDQIVQPYMFGDDASKATCLWLWGLDEIPVPARTRWHPPRFVQWRGRSVERWSNQTDSGQNALSPGEDRWKERSRTYPGLGSALVAHVAADEPRRQGSLFASTGRNS